MLLPIQIKPMNTTCRVTPNNSTNCYFNDDSVNSQHVFPLPCSDFGNITLWNHRLCNGINFKDLAGSSWIVLYCIVCHVNLRSQEDCTRFRIKFSGQPMRRVGGSGGRFGSCQVESIVYRIKLYQETSTVHTSGHPRPPPPPPKYPPLSHWLNIKFCCTHLCCSSFVVGLGFIAAFVCLLFPNQSLEQLRHTSSQSFSSTNNIICLKTNYTSLTRVYPPSSCWVDTPYPPPL